MVIYIFECQKYHNKWYYKKPLIICWGFCNKAVNGDL
jgi:hypothetical protein